MFGNVLNTSVVETFILFDVLTFICIWSQTPITCSKFITETLEKGIKLAHNQEFYRQGIFLGIWALW